MDKKVLIVGSGASGVHFALSVVQKGYQVIMLDVGYEKPDIVNPEDNFNSLKEKLNDPAKYFLGQNFESVIYPDDESEFYGFPPNKKYVFSKLSNFKFQSKGFEPLFSFAQGGLAEAWTGGVYSFNDYDLSDFPFCYKDIEQHYNEVAKRIGITGENDDLASFFPFHKNILEPLNFDEHSNLLLTSYEKHKDYLNNKLKCYLGRSRISTLSKDKGKRKGCTYCGRCLWGCPIEALYVPSISLNECKKHPNFKYIPNTYVNHFKYNSKCKITNVVAKSINDNKSHEFPVDKLVLAAGTLSSSKIFMDSIFKNSGEIIKLNGLMDNRQILIPFLNLNMIGQTYNPENYQYHQIAMGIDCEDPKEYIHMQITTLKTALIHPIINNLPLDLKTSIYIFRNIHSALGVVNVNLHDTRREGNYLSLEVNNKSSGSKLVINYSPAIHEKTLIKKAIKKTKKALMKLGCVAPSGMIHVRPMGASVHYSGTIPMSSKNRLYTT